MALSEPTGGMRNTSVNVPADVKNLMDSMVNRFETTVETISRERGLRRAWVRSRLTCNSAIAATDSALYIVGSVANGMPSTYYFRLESDRNLDLETVFTFIVDDFGFPDPFGLQLPPLEALADNETLDAQLTQIAMSWVKAEETRRMKESMLIKVSPIFGPPSYSIRPDSCFVIGPFSKVGTEIYENVIKEVVESAGMVCHRANEMATNRAIMEDIWRSICEARFVIADLSGRNANVFYELGIAHTLGKDTILLMTKDEEGIPFDIQSLRQIRFTNDVAGGQQLRRDLAATIENIIKPKVVAQREGVYDPNAPE